MWTSLFVSIKSFQKPESLFYDDAKRNGTEGIDKAVRQMVRRGGADKGLSWMESLREAVRYDYSAWARLSCIANCALRNFAGGGKFKVWLAACLRKQKCAATMWINMVELICVAFAKWSRGRQILTLSQHQKWNRLWPNISYTPASKSSKFLHIGNPC